jgi:hypothetical protein
LKFVNVHQIVKACKRGVYLWFTGCASEIGSPIQRYEVVKSFERIFKSFA